MSRRRHGLALIALLALVLAVFHPTTDIRINLHDTADPTPRRIVAAIDTGLMGVSVLITWTAQIAR